MKRTASAAAAFVTATAILMITTSLSISPAISRAQGDPEAVAPAAPAASTPAGGGASSSSKDYKLIKDIPYLGPGRTEKLDAYLPDPQKFPGPRPAVIVIHGGAWKGGDKATARELDICGTLAKGGYACFSINYKLSVYKDKSANAPLIKHGWPDNFQDCRDAIRFVRREAATYSVDAAHVALLGTSAGGHLALLTAFAPATLLPRVSSAGAEADAKVSTKVNCVISMYGRHDLGVRGAAWPVEVLGADIMTVASPKTYFTKDGPPVLIIQGDKDKTVLPEVATDMANTLEKAGVKHELIWVPGAAHMFHLHPPGGKDIEKPVLEFLSTNLK